MRALNETSENQDELLLSYADFGYNEIWHPGTILRDLRLELAAKDKNNIDSTSNPTRETLEITYEDEIEKKKKELQNFFSIPEEYKYLNNASEAVQLATVRKNGRLIQYIKNPSEQVQLAALEGAHHYLAVIKFPTNKVQEVALNMSAYSLEVVRFFTPIKKATKQLAQILSNPRVKKKYVIDFLDCIFIEGDKLEFINRYGSKKAKKIAMEYELSGEKDF